jgi:hypothetical protein
MPIKSFRGLIADGAIDIISLHTNTGSTGYKITKFEIMANQPGAQTYENIVKIYKIPQSSVDGVIDFSDNTLLAAAYFESNSGAGSLPFYQFAIFDNEIFNQDIYITASDVNVPGGVGQPINYYIELETMPLALDENTVATLKDIRNIKSNE